METMIQKKEKALKRVHIFGRLYILLGVLDLLMLILTLLGEREEILAAFAANGLSKGVNDTFLAVVAAITILMAAIKIYVGLQGSSCTQEKKMKKSGIKLAKLLMVLAGLSLVVQLLGFFTGGGDWVQASSSAASLMIIFSFIQNAEELSE